MNSNDAFELFSGYLEGELSAEEADALRQHFEHVPEDRVAYDEFAATVQLVHSLPRAEAPASFTDRVMHAVREARLTEDTAAPWGADDPFLPQPVGVSVPAERGVKDVGAGDGSTWRGVLSLAAMLAVGFLSAWVLLSTRPGAPDHASTGSPDATPIAVAGDAPASADVLWNELQPLGDEPLRQVGSRSDRPSIVF